MFLIERMDLDDVQTKYEAPSFKKIYSYSNTNYSVSKKIILRSFLKEKTLSSVEAALYIRDWFSRAVFDSQLR